MLVNLLLGLALGGATAWLGYHRRHNAPRFLSPSGVVGVILISVATFLAGGWSWGLAPLLFFASTAVWARFRFEIKRGLGARFQAGATRHWEQVLARGGWATLLALLAVLGGRSTADRNLVLHAAFVGAWAATTADAWATEVGVLSAFLPNGDRTRLLISQRRVSPGVPGGVSVLGLLGGIVGSWLQGVIALLGLAVYAWLDQLPLRPGLGYLPVAAMLGGLAGSLTDSFLGATAQGVYYCEACEQLSETPVHSSCGGQARPIRGWGWLSNDWVNFVGSLIGAAVTAALMVGLA